MKEEQIKLTLPFLPISVNTAYSGYRVRHKSNQYKEFENKMKVFFANYIKYKITGNKFLEVKYILKMPIYNKNGTIKKIDVANYEKVLSDTLSHHIEGFNDEKIKKIVMEKVESTERVTEVVICEI